MKVMEFRAVYTEGQAEIITVYARSINSGMTKALKQARKPLGNGQERELATIEFWCVR
jgi:hypothetical protein